jgi:acyl-CoA thioester hydrolase
MPTPFDSGTAEVLPAWIDSNDHMNLAYYTVLFDRATDLIYEEFGLHPGYKAATNCGTFAAESHNLYENELRLGNRVRMTTLVLGADAKRLHLAHEMYRLDDGRRAAMQELMYLHVDLGMRRVVPWPADVRVKLDRFAAAHAALPTPAWVGRRIAMPARDIAVDSRDGPAHLDLRGPTAIAP